MGLTNIKLRITTHSPLTTKGSELTYAELDNNFIELYDFLSSLGSAANLTPYNAGTVYSNTPPTYVSYSGNIFQFIYGTPTSGVTPGTNPTIWQQVTIGALSHVQNTDQYIDQGGSFESTAEEIFGAIHNIVIDTKANILTLISGSDLVPGRFYFNTTDNIGQFAVSNSLLNPMGWLYADYTALPAGIVAIEAVEYDISIGKILKRWDAFGNYVASAGDGSDDCMDNFPFGDDVSKKCCIEFCTISASPGTISGVKAESGSTIDVPTGGTLIDAKIGKNSIFTMANAAYAQNVKLNDNASFNYDVDAAVAGTNIYLDHEAIFVVTGTSALTQVEVGFNANVAVNDTNITNIKFGDGFYGVIDTQNDIIGGSVASIIGKNNNSVLGGTIASATTLDLSGYIFCGKVIVNGSGTVNTITNDTYQPDSFDVVIAPDASTVLTFDDISVGFGNLHLDTGSVSVDGSKKEKIIFRFDASNNHYYMIRKEAYV